MGREQNGTFAMFARTETQFVDSTPSPSHAHILSPTLPFLSADSDNDKITVCDDEGLREALNELKVGNTLRLELLDKRPAAALAATEATNAAAPAATTTMTTTTVAATATTSAATEAVAAALRPTSRSTAPHPAASTLRPLSMATTTVEGAVGPGINLQPVALAKNLAAPAAAAAQQFAGVKPQPTLTAIKPEARSDLQMRPLYVARKPEGSAATSTEGTAAAPPASTYNLVSSPIYVSEPIGEKPKSHAKPPTTDSSKLLRGMLRPPSKEVVLAAAQAAAKAAEDSTRESAVKSTAKPTAAKPTAKSTATPTATLAANPATRLMARPTTQTTAKPAAAAAQRPVAARTAAPRAAAAAAAAAHTPSSTTPRTAPRPSKGLQKPPSASGKSGAAQRAAIATNAATAAAAGGAPSEASGLGSNFGVTYKGGYLLAQDMVGQIAAEAVDPYTDFFLPLADANYFMSTEQYPGMRGTKGNGKFGVARRNQQPDTQKSVSLHIATDFIIVGAGAVGLNTAMGIAYNSNETNKKIWVLESGSMSLLFV